MALIAECPAGGCPDRLYVGQGYYIPGDPWQFRYEVESYRNSLLVIFGVFAWEWFVTFPEEISRWKQIFRRELVPVNTCVLTARWAAWAAVASVCMYAFADWHSNCQANLTIIMVFVAINSIALSFIHYIRVSALYSRSVGIRRITALLVLLNAVAWIVSVVGFKAAPISPLLAQPHLASCGPAPSPRWRVLGWGVSMLVDLSVLILALRGTNAIQKDIRLVPGGTSVITLLQGSAWINFSVTFVGNAACFFTTLFSNNLILSNIPIAISTLFNTIIAARVVFHSISWNDGNSTLLAGPHAKRPDLTPPYPDTDGDSDELTRVTPISARTADEKTDSTNAATTVMQPSILRRGSDTATRLVAPAISFFNRGSRTETDKEYDEAVFRGLISPRRESEPASARSAQSDLGHGSSAKRGSDIESQRRSSVQWSAPNPFHSNNNNATRSPRQQTSSRVRVPDMGGANAGYELQVTPHQPRSISTNPPPSRSTAASSGGRSASGHGVPAAAASRERGIKVHTEVFRITHPSERE